MREIKFRAWDLVDKCMILPERFNSLYSYAESAELDFWLNNPGTMLMQFTGLLDKNDSEIFEGDILHIPNEIYRLSQSPFWECLDSTRNLDSVIFDNERGFYVFDKIKMPVGLTSKQCEIIGNIYEDPAALNENNP